MAKIFHSLRRVVTSRVVVIFISAFTITVLLGRNIFISNDESSTRRGSFPLLRDTVLQVTEQHHVKHNKSPSPKHYIEDALISLNKKRPSQERSIEGGIIDLDERVPSADELYKRMAIVTAFSENHYQEALAHIATVQKWMPDKKSIVYDLGITNETLIKAKSLCNVEIRPFPFDRYPEHVKTLRKYAFKPIIIDLTLREFGVMFWGDASQRFIGSVKDLLPHVADYHGFMAKWFEFQVPKNSVKRHHFHLTVPQTFEALGVNRTEYYYARWAPHVSPNQDLIVNSTTIQEKVIQPLLACALDPNCISPPKSSTSNHRFDSSVLDLILYKNMQNAWTPEHCGNNLFRKVSYVARDTDGWEEAQFCEDATQR